jgi:UDP:flavonoid glycosyltransferase YjiC (YdhE family)
VNVGIVCYASVGGSGVVATELGKALARRGHQVHFISTETPFRLGEFQAGLAFHQVLTPTYPLFREPQYMLSLANKLVQVARNSASTSSTRIMRFRTHRRRSSRARCWPRPVKVPRRES